MRPELSYNERWLRARPYSFAMLFVWLVPGLVLSFARDVQLLPASIVRFLYPYAILPWEKVFVTEVLGSMHAGGVAAMDLSRPSALSEQSVVLAFVSFFLVILVTGLQTWADALFSDQPIKVLPTALLMLPVAMLMRCYFLYMQFLHAEAVVLRQPTHSLVFQTGHFLAPWELAVSTCLAAKTIHVIGRVTHLYLAGRYETSNAASENQKKDYVDSALNSDSTNDRGRRRGPMQHGYAKVHPGQLNN